MHGNVFQAARIEIERFEVPPPATPPPPVPWGCPAPLPGFENRVRELARLKRLSPGRGHIALSGPGGVGKTQLLARFADLHADSFPDGILYADLDADRRDGAANVGAVLGDFLGELGVRGEQVPASDAARAARLRSLLRQRRSVVFLDNVRHAPEARPFLELGTQVFVISRRELRALRLDGADLITVDPLDERAGTALLRRWDERADEDTARRLVRLCGGLPLALRLVAQRLLDADHRPLEDLVAELEGAEAGADAVLDRVVAEFAPASADLYLRLGCSPCDAFTRATATASGAPNAAAGLRDLLVGHLATATAPAARADGTRGTDGGEPDAGEEGAGTGDPDGPRYRLHDVVRAHARAWARERAGTGLRAEVADGLLDFYVERAAHADRMVLGPRRLRLQPPPTGPQPFTGAAPALAWLDAERANLLAVVREAAARGRYEQVWWLCESLWALYHSLKHYSDWIEAHRLGVVAAQHLARPDVEVRMRNQLARAHLDLGEFEEARVELERAEPVLPLVADAQVRAVVWESQALLHGARGRHAEAVELLRLALAANEGDPRGELVQRNQLAAALTRAGRPAEALETLAGAALAAQAQGERALLMRLRLTEATTYRALGEAERALTYALEARALASALEQRAKLDQVLGFLAELAEEVSDPELLDSCRSALGRSRGPSVDGTAVDGTAVDGTAVGATGAESTDGAGGAESTDGAGGAESTESTGGADGTNASGRGPA
ncbi:NB-ARC domain-containing protein [Streptomyces sp. NPDC007088]|uniref:NB-ARC domain-containing protein n=1 Tax=Streptomyces sp. NPDC007088 TaxID=3364773 RepID=UPI0036AB1BAD